MSVPTQPLRDEHAGLFPSVDRIKQTAELIGKAPTEEICKNLEEVYDFLAHHLKIHAQAEEAVLYPVVQKLLGSPDATRTMGRDHLEIGSYIDELALLKQCPSDGKLTSEQSESLRRVLYGVYALTKVHFAKEEEVYLPILDQRMTVEEVREMYTRMEAAAHEAMRAVH